MYDKQGSVLRVETTIVHPRHFSVYRPSERDPEQRLGWRYLRRGVADLWRRAEVSRCANTRYLDALATVTSKTPLAHEAHSVCRPVFDDRRRYRALNPWAPNDAALLEAISRGEFTLHGFRNRDLRTLLFGQADTPATRRKQAAAITRMLALLHAHGLIKKITRTHRWTLTTSGRRIVTALLTARHADIDQLTKIAA